MSGVTRSDRHDRFDKRVLMSTSPHSAHTPPPFKVSRWTVQRKLVLAFWLVSVIPTMIASELAATTLSHIFDSNVRVWLQESTKIVKDEISETLLDNARAAKLFCNTPTRLPAVKPFAMIDSPPTSLTPWASTLSR